MAFKREVKPSGGCNWRSDSPNERPLVHFFKIILPCILDYKKLRIPNKFVRRYGEELSGVAKVIVPSGHAWEIGLTKDQSNIWFDEGWQKFVEHHSIRFGYLLVFAYRGCCNFSVLIFDMSGCEIQYPCPSVGPTSAKKTNYDLNGFGRKGKSSERHNASAEQNLGMKRHRRCISVQQSQNLKQFGDKTSEKFVKEVDAEIIDLEDDRESRKEKLNYHRMSRTCQPLLNEIKDRGIVAGIPARAFPERSRVIRPVKKVKPESPSFKVTLKPYNIHKHLLYVPCGFARRHLLGGPAVIKLKVSNERYWPVQVVQSDHRRVTLTKGWSKFIGENDLVEGDVCTFELVEDNGSLLKVTISRDDVMKDEGTIESIDSQYCCALESGVFDEDAGESRQKHPSKPPPSENNAQERPCFERSGDKRGKIPVMKEHIVMAELDDTDESTRRKLSKKCRLPRPHGSLVDETKVNKGKSKIKFDETEFSLLCGEDTDIIACGFAKASEESKKAIHAARMFRPKHPSFMVLLRSYNKCFVPVPAEFSKRHLSGVSEHIKLQVSDGRQWPLRLNKTQRARMIMSRGWNEFKRENNLKEGDVCVFELIKNKKISLQVSMFRAVDGSGPSN